MKIFELGVHTWHFFVFGFAREKISESNEIFQNFQFNWFLVSGLDKLFYWIKGMFVAVTLKKTIKKCGDCFFSGLGCDGCQCSLELLRWIDRNAPSIKLVQSSQEGDVCEALELTMGKAQVEPSKASSFLAVTKILFFLLMGVSSVCIQAYFA